MPHDSVKFLESLYEIGKVFFVGASAGIAQTLYAIKKGEKTNWTAFIINASLAIFVANVLYFSLPETPLKISIISLFSFGAFPFLNTIYSIIPDVVKTAVRAGLNKKD